MVAMSFIYMATISHCPTHSASSRLR